MLLQLSLGIAMLLQLTSALTTDELIGKVSALETQTSDLKTELDKVKASSDELIGKNSALETQTSDLKTELDKVKASSDIDGVTYVRWGRLKCDGNGTQLLYKGYAAGRFHHHQGSGSNHLCLPEAPQYGGHTDGTSPTISAAAAGWLYGMSYAVNDKHKTNLVSSVSSRGPMPCAVCYVPSRSASVMIPASTSCPADWTQEYGGYVMSERGWSETTYGQHHPSNYICADGASEVAPAGYTEYQAMAFFVKLGCGVLPCDKFKQGWEVACVVCTK